MQNAAWNAPHPNPPPEYRERRQLPKVTGHIPALDGLRGLAIAMVMVCHFLPYSDSPTSAVGKLVFVAGRSGALGVDLFFVLSGFLITGILIEAKGKVHYFRNFYARRTLRIFPLYYAVLAAAFLVLPLLYPGAFATPELEALRRQQGWLWAYGANVAMTIKRSFPFNAEWANFNPFWSLAVEEHFYLVWPAVVFLCGRRALVGVCIAFMVIALVTRCGFWARDDWHGTYVFTISRMDALALGALLAVAMRSAAPAVRRLLAWAPWVGGICLAGMLLIAWYDGRHATADNDSLPRATLFYTLAAAAFGMLLVRAVAARRGSWLHAAFNAAALRFLGKYSYGLYVYHVVLGGTFERLFGQRDIQAWLQSRLHLGHAAYGASILAYMFLAAAASVAVACLSWHLFENQLLKLKRYFEYAPEKPDAAAAA